jgi:hypothetical protein
MIPAEELMPTSFGPNDIDNRNQFWSFVQKRKKMIKII